MYLNGATAEVSHSVETDGHVAAPDVATADRTVTGVVPVTALAVASVVAVSFPVVTMFAALVGAGVAGIRHQATRTGGANSMGSDDHVRAVD